MKAAESRVEELKSLSQIKIILYSFTSVSLNPMLILVCVDERAKILPLLHKKKRFGISVLKQDQQAVSEYFAQAEQKCRSRTPSGVALSLDCGEGPCSGRHAASIELQRHCGSSG